VAARRQPRGHGAAPRRARRQPRRAVAGDERRRLRARHLAHASRPPVGAARCSSRRCPRWATRWPTRRSPR
jgi:hypothetical protein